MAPTRSPYLEKARENERSVGMWQGGRQLHAHVLREALCDDHLEALQKERYRCCVLSQKT
jgi:hypothetical protein